MTYQIVEERPTYCQITDGITGSSFHRLPMSYTSEALAQKLAARLHDEDYRDCGDNSYFVIEYGASVFKRIYARIQQTSDDMPW